MPKVTLEEKRLETLRRQLYGKAQKSDVGNQKSEVKTQQPTNDNQYSMSNPPPVTLQSPTQSLVDSNYLRKDLTKIFYLSSLALGTQLLLYFLTKNHLVNLHF